MEELKPQPRWGQNYQRFPEAILMVALGLPLIIGGVDLAEWLEEAQCSWDSFLTGTLHPNMQIALIMFAAVAWYAIIRHLLLHKFAFLRRWLKVELTCDRHWHEQWGGFAIGGLVVSLVGFYLVASSQYCLTLYVIKHRPIFANALITHQWRDVSKIEVECHRGSKGRTAWTYDLVMRDGTRLDISDSNEGMYWAYPYLQQVLAKVEYSFDTSRIRPDCPMSPDDPARQRP